MIKKTFLLILTSCFVSLCFATKIPVKKTRHGLKFGYDQVIKTQEGYWNEELTVFTVERIFFRLQW